jgi:signal transduction histidine kinase
MAEAGKKTTDECVRGTSGIAGPDVADATGARGGAAGEPARIRTLERDLAEARARLRDALAVQDRFISNVSHELKTPISVVLTEAQTIQVSELPAEGQRFVQSVTDEMRRLSRMIQSFLTLARLHGGRTLEHTRTCIVNEFVMDAIAGCTPLARRAGVTLIPELAECEGPLIVTGEMDLLQTLVDNLIRNAVRFSPAGSPVQVRVTMDAPDCVVTVRDSGPGCPEDLLDKVSGRFVQVPMAGLPGRGNGLGLSIAQGIAELHGGRITVINVPAGGCEFAVRLPVTVSSTPSPPA